MDKFKKSIIIAVTVVFLIAFSSLAWGEYHSKGVSLPPSGLIIPNQTRSLQPAGYLPSDFIVYKGNCGELMSLSCVDPAIFGVIQQKVLNPHLFTDAWEIQENWDYDQAALKEWADAPAEPLVTVKENIWGSNGVPVMDVGNIGTEEQAYLP